MRRIGFILKPEKSDANSVLTSLVAWAVNHGHQAKVVDEDHVAPPGALIVPEAKLASEVEVVVVLGGDGTMLRASSLVADAGVPVIGVNLGRLGFLTPFAPDQASTALAAALDGTLPITERMRLAVSYEPRVGDKVVRTALNDVVIHQGAMARLIELNASVEDETIAAYRADGLIVATPTGSTAYNLAAGGPIIMPGQKAMALTPICAHSLTNRPLVLPHSATLQLQLGGHSRGVVLTVDGQWAHSFLPGDKLMIRPANRPLLLHEYERGYFDVLRNKLHWGARSDRDAD